MNRFVANVTLKTQPMSRIKSLVYLTLIFVFSACSGKKDDLVVIHTEYGDITVKLYDKTVMHHDNFMALAESGYYDGTLFHRVIKNFMIQGGDPESKHAQPGTLLGEGDTSYTIPFEYVKSYIHKRGAVAAARESDDINPQKASSGTQFYIVQGKKFTDDELDAVEVKVERRTKQYILMNLLKKSGDTVLLNRFRTFVGNRDTANIRIILDQYRNAVEAEYMKLVPFRLSPEQREVYQTIGGAPHLDGSYTVFGEVVSGMEIVDKIAAAKTDQNDRPVVDIPMKMTIKNKRKQ